MAVRCRITAIRQEKATVHIHPQKLDLDLWSELAEAFPGQLRMMMSGEPHILLRLQKEDEALMLIYNLFEKYMKICNEKA